MPDIPVLLLLTSRSVSRHQVVCGGISLLEPLAADKLDDGPPLWLLRGGDPESVRVVHHQVSHSHLSTSEGSMWETDGRIERTRDRDRRAGAFELVRNGFNYVKFSPPAELGLPVFVGSEPRLRPCRDELVVRMRATRLIDFPDARVQQKSYEAMFRPTNSALVEARQRLESMPPEAGLTTPVEFGDESRPVRCVLYLLGPAGEGRFRCRLYRSDRTAAIAPGTVLRRRAERHLTHQSFREASDIAEVLAVGASGGPIEPEQEGLGIVTREKDGAILPILCFACGRSFAPEQFTAEQLQVIDLWGWLYPMERERSILERARRFYARRPQARGQVRTKFDAIWFGPDRKLDLRTFNTPVNELPDPRPANYQKKLDEWTAGDRELRDFLEHTSCDVGKRLEFVREKVDFWERRLQGRCVVCPACGGGMVGIAENRG